MLTKILDPFMKPAAKFYQARLSKELNKMGMSIGNGFPLSRRTSTCSTSSSQSFCVVFIISSSFSFFFLFAMNNIKVFDTKTL